MIRVYVVVEGQTEVTFIKKQLWPAFSNLDIWLQPALIGKPGHKGGVISYQRAKKDIIKFLKQEPNTYCTTMFDYYQLPVDFPGCPIQGNYSSVKKVEILEHAFKDDIIRTLEDKFNPTRFIPYLQIHEFEALLFSNPQALAEGIYRADLTTGFEKIRQEFPSPEEINDHPQSAPSKRILNCHPNYKKSTDGILAAIKIGLSTMRKECAHFDQWLKKLETLP